MVPGQINRVPNVLSILQLSARTGKKNKSFGDILGTWADWNVNVAALWFYESQNTCVRWCIGVNVKSVLYITTVVHLRKSDEKYCWWRAAGFLKKTTAGAGTLKNTRRPVCHCTQSHNTCHNIQIYSTYYIEYCIKQVFSFDSLKHFVEVHDNFMLHLCTNVLDTDCVIKHSGIWYCPLSSLWCVDLGG